jgi:hypothetical protein
VHLRDNWGTNSGKDLVLLEYNEKTSLGVAEWVAYVGAAFDKEATAARVFADTVAAYNCAKGAVAGAALQLAAKPKVLWVGMFNNAYGGWFIGECPNYYCGLVADAGGEGVAAAEAVRCEGEALPLRVARPLAVAPARCGEGEGELDGVGEKPTVGEGVGVGVGDAGGQPLTTFTWFFLSFNLKFFFFLTIFFIYLNLQFYQ